MTFPSSASRPKRPPQHGFSQTDLCVVLAVVMLLAAVAVPLVLRVRNKSRQTQCAANLQQVSRACLLYAEDNKGLLPMIEPSPAPGAWWFYKEQVKGYLNLKGPSSPEEKIFACPSDRGYGETAEPAAPFRQSRKHNYTSYVFNNVNLPGVPSIAGRTVASVREPARTLLVDRKSVV